MNHSLTSDELLRYDRQMILPDFGLEAQEKIKSAKVLVIGAGGLGCPILLYLAAAGVGTIGIVDFDTVSISNLHRQVLYEASQTDTLKVEQAKNRLQHLNPYVKVEIYPFELTKENALEVINLYDVVADGTDNFATRYLVNDACVILKKPNVYASVFQYEGQVAVFNHLLPNGSFSPHYRDLFPEPPENAPNCAEGGVLGVLPAIIGSMQGLEVLKIITGIGDVLAGKLFRFDALTFRSQVMRYNKSAESPVIEHLAEDYQVFCGLKQASLLEISVEEWQKRIAEGEDFQIIDVREMWEYETRNLNGILIPLAELEKNLHLIDSKRNTIVHCQSGGRSAQAVKLLREKYGFKQVYNLKGGISAVK